MVNIVTNNTSSTSEITDTKSDHQHRRSMVKSSTDQVGSSTIQNNTTAIQQHRQQCHDLQILLSSLKDENASLIEGGNSWNDVIQSIDAAKQTYSDKRRHSGTENVHAKKAALGTLEMLADIIPDQNGLSVLRGGLKVVFKLVRRRVQNREAILEAFEDIPWIFHRACQKLQIHPDDAQLRQFCKALFTTLVEEVRKLINIFLRQHEGSWTSRLFRQHPEHEASIISSCLESVLRASSRVAEQTEVLCGKDTVDNLKETRLNGIKIEENTNQIQLGNAALDRKFEALCLAVEKQGRVSSELLFKITEGIQYEFHLIQGNMSVHFAGLTQSLASSHYPHRDYFLPWPSDAIEAMPFPISRMPASTGLLAALHLPNPGLVDEDIDTVLQASNNMRGSYNDAPLEQAGYLVLDPRFQSWLQPGRGTSDVILVHGKMRSSTEGRLSGLSVVAAMFFTVRHFPRFVILHHFCGLHNRLIDAGSGPVGLMQRLIAQLLAYFNGDLGPAGLPGISDIVQTIEGAAAGDIAALCLIFRSLLCLLDSRTVVYCIIDGIDDFEGDRGGWDGQMCGVVDFLSQSAADGSVNGPVLKVMLTAAEQSIVVSSLLGTDRQIWLSREKRLSRTGDPSALASDLGGAMAF